MSGRTISRRAESGAVKRETGIALWRQIAERLEAEIAEGLYPPGGRLPTEGALAARFAVNRHTLRRAIKALTEAGLIKAVQGSGTFVAAKPIAYRIGARTRFSENVGAEHRAAGGEVLASAVVAAPAAVAEGLGVEPGTRVARLEVLRRADGVPICVSTSWFPAERFPRMAQLMANGGSVTAAFAAQGLADYRRRSTRVTARPADARDAEVLDEPVGRTLLVVEAVNIDAEGRPVQFACTRFAADRVELVVEHEAGESAGG